MHHRAPGGMGGTPFDRDTLPNVIALRPRCHNLAPGSVHGNPTWSMPLGLLLPARERAPETRSVRHWSAGWVWLTPDGAYLPVP